MKKNPTSQSAHFNQRLLLAAGLCLLGAWLTMLSFAANPPMEMRASATNSAPDSVFSDEENPVPLSAGVLAGSMPLAPVSGPGWSIVTSPNSSTTHFNTFYGVACASASACWAVGRYYNGSVNQTLIEHWDGKFWSNGSAPNSSATQHNQLEGVACSSATDCWAVGYYYNGSVYQTLIEHWNGSFWSIVPSPNSSGTQFNQLLGVTCVSASQCWAVGYYHTGSVEQTLIEHWNGTFWSIITSANTSTTQFNQLLGVTCVSASQCWAVGDYYNGSVLQTLIEQWNGSSWAVVSSPNANATQHNRLLGVTCVSASQCWAVGDYNYDEGTVAQTLIERWNGTSWSVVTSPNVNTIFRSLQSVTCSSASQCWAVGFYGNGSVDQTLIEQWNGTSWSIATSPNTSATQNNALYGVTCVSASNCWAVGSGAKNNVGQTLIEEYSPTIPPLTGVVSRMKHPMSGVFDIDLPLTGARGIECRTSAALGSGNYSVVFTFLNNVTNCGSAGTTGGSVSSGPLVNECTENLTGVPNAQYTTVTLNNVLDSENNNGNVSVPMGVLLGDVNGSGVVTNLDVALVKGQIGATQLSSSNFRDDVNTNGVVSNTDISSTKLQVGSLLP